jgi:hypothetical protein
VTPGVLILAMPGFIPDPYLMGCQRATCCSNLTDQASVVKFIEDNWLGGQRLGNGSFDAISGSLDARGGVLDFRVRPNFTPLILNPATGAVVSG